MTNGQATVEAVREAEAIEFFVIPAPVVQAVLNFVADQPLRISLPIFNLLTNSMKSLQDFQAGL